MFIKQYIPKWLKRTLKYNYHAIKVRGKQKIFCIGLNKTGTTSMKVAMKELGFAVGDQRSAEMLVDDWARRDFRRLIRYCRSAQFFQDVPFSYPFTYIAIDQAFPGSKFILTVRDTPEQWYKSLTRFHAKKWGKDGRIPTKEDLQEATYIYKGRPWHTNRLYSITPEDDPYNKELLIKDYIDYNRMVCDYFRHRPDDLLVLNIAEKEAYPKLCYFLGKPCKKKEFPWANKT